MLLGRAPVNGRGITPRRTFGLRKLARHRRHAQNTGLRHCQRVAFISGGRRTSPGPATAVRARVLNVAKAHGPDFNQGRVRFVLKRILHARTQSRDADRFLVKHSLLFTRLDTTGGGTALAARGAPQHCQTTAPPLASTAGNEKASARLASSKWW